MPVDLVNLSNDQIGYRRSRGRRFDKSGQPLRRFFQHEAQCRNDNPPCVNTSSMIIDVLQNTVPPVEPVERAIVACRGSVLSEDDFRFLQANGGGQQYRVPSTMSLAEMEKLMMTHIVVKEDDLRLLAMKRAETSGMDFRMIRSRCAFCPQYWSFRSRMIWSSLTHLTNLKGPVPTGSSLCAVTAPASRHSGGGVSVRQPPCYQYLISSTRRGPRWPAWLSVSSMMPWPRG